jgi:predicted metal-dependent peptidase
MSKKAPVNGEAMAEQAMRQVSLQLPSLSGLAHFVRLEPSERHPTAGVFASGRIVFNPRFFASLTLQDATFVMAHELMHLALRTHERGQGRYGRFVNIAHDYIINDVLQEELGIGVPAGGLVFYGARHRSLEELVAWLERERPAPQRWSVILVDLPNSAVSEALARAGLGPPKPAPREQWDGEDRDDVLDEALEREWFPSSSPPDQTRRTAVVRELAANAAARHRIWTALSHRGGSRSGSDETDVEVLRAAYAPPWQQALQRWMEFQAPGNRSFSRPSRRGADRTDVVLPGRVREGWTLHIVLDTSGSMVDTFPRILGALATFASSAGVSLMHVLQCDAAVTRDEWIEVENLHRVTVAGLGGSDMSPAMDQLAYDPEVQAVLVLTDGQIEYPREPPPYDVVWVLTEANLHFQPGYGETVVFE